MASAEAENEKLEPAAAFPNDSPPGAFSFLPVPPNPPDPTVELPNAVELPKPFDPESFCFESPVSPPNGFEAPPEPNVDPVPPKALLPAAELPKGSEDFVEPPNGSEDFVVAPNGSPVDAEPNGFDVEVELPPKGFEVDPELPPNGLVAPPPNGLDGLDSATWFPAGLLLPVAKGLLASAGLLPVPPNGFAVPAVVLNGFGVPSAGLAIVLNSGVTREIDSLPKLEAGGDLAGGAGAGLEPPPRSLAPKLKPPAAELALVSIGTGLAPKANPPGRGGASGALLGLSFGAGGTAGSDVEKLKPPPLALRCRLPAVVSDVAKSNPLDDGFGAGWVAAAVVVAGRAVLEASKLKPPLAAGSAGLLAVTVVAVPLEAKSNPAEVVERCRVGAAVGADVGAAKLNPPGSA